MAVHLSTDAFTPRCLGVLPRETPENPIRSELACMRCGFEHYPLALERKMPTPEIMKQMLTSPYLADKPLLFTQGQTVFHRELGICEVVRALGARKRQISYRVFNEQQQPESKTAWVDVTDLSDMELAMQSDVSALTPDQIGSTDRTNEMPKSAFRADNRQS